MTQHTRPSAADLVQLRTAARMELAAALAVLEDADGHTALACPHLCQGWLHAFRAAGVEAADIDALDLVANPGPGRGLAEADRKWLGESLPALVNATLEQRARVELRELPLDTLRRHARLLHTVLLDV